MSARPDDVPGRPVPVGGVVIADVIAVLERWYDPAWAESWDAVGLVCGDRRERVERVLLAVDAVPATVAQAERVGAQLLLTHHPLLLTAVHGVPADDPKGGLVHRMIRSRIAHFVAHTNAEVGAPGVSDALADRLGLRDVGPVQPVDGPPLDKITVFVPSHDVDALVEALARAGAGRIGDYDRCAWWVEGIGTFRPGPAARPARGRSGEIEQVAEVRLEMVLEPSRRADVLAALRAAHPYEEPAFDLISHAPGVDRPGTGRRGVGRVGRLANPLTLRGFTDLVAARLPVTVAGVRASGDPDRLIERVAVLAGSGASLIGAARAAGADVLLTADLRHHDAVEAVTQRTGGPMALVDAAHWATEHPWLAATAARLRGEFGDSVRFTVSDTVTDPWAVHVPATASAAPAGARAAVPEVR